ncbi:MAG: L,D-transpeptidase [Eubacteriales bacterium]|nr:L,D-transpeptidase [Eubacteriales bacterium]
MSRKTALRAAALLLLCALLSVSTASAKTVAEWLEGYRTGKDWFGDETDYDITNEAACWELLMKPITVLDKPENESVYPLDAPGGSRVNNDYLGGFINGASAAVHVLGEDEGGWTLIEGLDYYNRIIRGYVRTRLLKQITPNEHYGVIVDKLTQRLYVFIDGKLFSSCAVSTGLPNDEQPFNETASGEYVLISWSGGFDSEGMWCAMAIRFNNGDKIHEVPCMVLGDGTKRYTPYEAKLGQKASHGCIRVARKPNAEGLCQEWIWNNLKRMTKVVIWDDAGRVLPYPDDATPLYYNPAGGQYYHAEANCSGVKAKYLPLTEFTYGELDDSPYSALEPCPFCVPVRRKAVIDKGNLDRGGISQEVYDALAELHPQEAADEAADDGEHDAGGAIAGDAQVQILPAD